MSGEFDAMLVSLRALSTLPEDAAKLAAPLVDEAIKVTVRAGQDPMGKPWLALKRGKGSPLVHAADHITTRAIGKVVRVTLTGPDVFHHGGYGVPKRQILPDPGTIPPAVATALELAAERAFSRAVA